MESATVAAQGYRFRVPYGTLLCVSDKPLHGELKLPGQANDFYETCDRPAPADRHRDARPAAARRRGAPLAQAAQLRRAAAALARRESRIRSGLRRRRVRRQPGLERVQIEIPASNVSVPSVSTEKPSPPLARKLFTSRDSGRPARIGLPLSVMATNPLSVAAATGRSRSGNWPTARAASTARFAGLDAIELLLEQRLQLRAGQRPDDKVVAERLSAKDLAVGDAAVRRGRDAGANAAGVDEGEIAHRRDLSRG